MSIGIYVMRVFLFYFILFYFIGNYENSLQEKGTTKQDLGQDPGRVKNDRLVNNRGSHTFSNEPNFFENEKVVREKGSQWGVLVHEGGMTPLFDVASMENEN